MNNTTNTKEILIDIETDNTSKFIRLHIMDNALLAETEDNSEFTEDVTTETMESFSKENLLLARQAIDKMLLRI